MAHGTADLTRDLDMRDEVRKLCHGCEHYYVTWDPAFPFGCRGFQMKSKRSPALSVYVASGRMCLLYEDKSRGDKSGTNREEHEVKY